MNDFINYILTTKKEKGMASVNTSIEQERKKVIIITFNTNILYITFVNKTRGYVNSSNDLNLAFFNTIA